MPSTGSDPLLGQPESHLRRTEPGDLEHVLREVPPEALIDGAPENADLLLARTLQALRSLR